MKTTDVMVDIETLGTDPNRHTIIQIAAVKFNLETMEVDPNTFNMCLTTPPSRSCEEGTVSWWSQQNQKVFEKIMTSRQPYRKVLEAYSEFFRSEETGAIEEHSFWGKPITFDFMFMSSYFKDNEIHFPHHFRQATDLNSYLRGLNQFTNINDRSKDFSKMVDMGSIGDATAHDALNDCFYQIKMLFEHVKNVSTV